MNPAPPPPPLVLLEKLATAAACVEEALPLSRAQQHCWSCMAEELDRCFGMLLFNRRRVEAHCARLNLTPEES